MIAIKNMEMPKECYMCPLLDDEYGVCKIVGEPKVDMTEERAKNCPLVEIVTCKDCKHRDTRTEKDGFAYCPKKRRDTHKEHFCGDGERRE